MVEALQRHEHKTEKKCQNDFEKDFLKLMNNSVFGKTVRNHRGISPLVPGVHYHTTKYFWKTRVKVNKLLYLGLSILDMSKIAKCEFWCDYGKRYMEQRLSYATLILIALESMWNHKTSMHILLKMLRKDLTHPTMKYKGNYPSVKTKKSLGW